LARYHNAATGGHGGIRKTRERLMRYYYWPDMRREIDQHVVECVTCGRTKARTHRPYGELAALPVPERPWQDITVDFVTGLPTSIDPRTHKPCDAVLVIVDKFTKYALYIATHKQLQAGAFAHLFFDYVYRPFGLPQTIVSDRGSLFTSGFWRALCDLLDVTQKLSTAYHPQTDGQTERQNQALEHYLRTYCAWEQHDWAQKLALAEHTYNTSVHSATKATPAYLLYGYHPRDPADPLANSSSNVPAAEERARKLAKDRERIREALVQANEGYAKWYNRKRTPMTFRVGQWVWVDSRHIRQRRPSSKLADKYLGPFKIIADVGSKKMAYRLDLPPAFKFHPVFSVAMLEPFNGNLQEALAYRDRVQVVAQEQHWEVEAILDHAGPPLDRYFLIKWKNYPPEENTWEPRRHIDDGPLLRAYEARIQDEHRRRR
jgi:transposase InsO family protein